MKQHWIGLVGSLIVAVLLGLSLVPVAAIFPVVSLAQYEWTVPTRTPMPTPTTQPPPPTTSPPPTTDPPTAEPTAAAPTPGVGTPSATATVLPTTPSVTGTVESTPVPQDGADVTPIATLTVGSSLNPVTATLPATMTVAPEAIIAAGETPTPKSGAQVDAPVKSAEEVVQSPADGVAPSTVPVVTSAATNVVWLFVGGAIIFILGALAFGAWWKVRG